MKNEDGWTPFVWAFLILALACCGCGAQGPTTLNPVSPEEAMLLSETARFAGMLDVRVRGVITDKQYVTPQGRATGWYCAGVAYYDREMVAQYVSLRR